MVQTNVAQGLQIYGFLNIVCKYLVGIFAQVIGLLQGFYLHRTSITLKN
jgi:hypothetical protein